MAMGRYVFALAAILAGVVGLTFRLTAAHPPAGQTELAGLWAIFGDAVLILGGIALTLGRRVAVCGALALAAEFALSAVVQLAPVIVRQWNVWGTWENLAELMALCTGAVCAWSLLTRADSAGRIARIARIVFGLCLVMFGIAHFAYLKYTASLVPLWLPPGQTFWAEATGAAHIAAGLAIISGLLARQAAVLLTAMFLGFGLMVHIPALVRDASSRFNWSEHDVNLMLVAAAWCVADSLSRSANPRPPAPQA